MVDGTGWCGDVDFAECVADASQLEIVGELAEQRAGIAANGDEAALHAHGLAESRAAGLRADIAADGDLTAAGHHQG